jgi:hypothetical protein
MSDINKRAGEEECGDGRKRGKRGHRGHDGATGPTGSTGPTGATGSSAHITHVEATINDVLIPLPPAALTTVLTAPPITAPVGTTLQFTGIVQYTNDGNSNGFADPAVVLLQDGFPNVDFATTTGARPTGGGKFVMEAILPLSWSLPGDGLPHVYSLAIRTDLVSDGTQNAPRSSIFINVIP